MRHPAQISAGLLGLATPSLVDRAASATPVMLDEISPVPAAASPTPRFISHRGCLLLDRGRDRRLEVADGGDDLGDLLDCRDRAGRTAWMASTRREMSSVARAVSWASSFTSEAATANPLPA
jgi:hypothetical protein